MTPCLRLSPHVFVLFCLTLFVNRGQPVIREGDTEIYMHGNFSALSFFFFFLSLRFIASE